MWNKQRSLLLSKIAVILFMVLLLVLLVAAPWLAMWFGPRLGFWLGPWLGLGAISSVYVTQPSFFLATIYTGGVAAAGVLVYLYRFLNNLGKGAVFTKQNVSFLRRISWFCFAGAAIAFISGFYYIPWFIVALAGAMLALLMRVVKNLLAEAVALKEENDFTI